MSPTHYGALYVVIPALLLLVAPTMVRACYAVSMAARAFYTMLRSMRVPASVKVHACIVAAVPMVLLSYIVVYTCPYVAPNAYLRAFYRAYDDIPSARYC